MSYAHATGADLEDLLDSIAFFIVDLAGLHHVRTFHVSNAPGLGVDFDETLAARNSYQLGSHPVVRLQDGTM